MIKSATNSSPNVVVSCSSAPYIYGNPAGLNIGNMRYNTTTQTIEVYDGNNWVGISNNHLSVGLSPIAESALSWAMGKMEEERRQEKLAQDHVIIRDLLNEKANIENKLRVAENLVKEHA